MTRSCRLPSVLAGAVFSLVLGMSFGLSAGAAIAAAPDPGGPDAASASSDTDKKDYSPAERLLFMTPQLGGVKPPQTLRYSFHKAGAFEPGYDDKVAVLLTAQSNGACCSANSEFLSAERRLPLPEIPEAQSNPVILYFLEHDVREMQRLTKGSQNHFRKLIRMAVYNRATLRDIQVRWKGRSIKAVDISFRPYLDDPNRPKYEKFVRKEYHFLLSEEVPGGVYGIRTSVAAEDDAKATPLIVEELYAEGAEPTAAATSLSRSVPIVSLPSRRTP